MTVAPGDVGFVHNTDWIDRMIQRMQERKYPLPAEESKYNHVFLVVDNNGGLIEAQGNGVNRNNLSNYSGVDYEIWRPNYSPPENALVAVAAMTELLGMRYGYPTIFCEALGFITDTKFRFGYSGEEICSGAVSYALTRANIDVGTDETYNSPADVRHVKIIQKWIRSG